MFIDEPPAVPARDDAPPLPRRIWRWSDLAIGFAVMLLGFVLVSLTVVVVVGSQGAEEDVLDIPGLLLTIAFELLFGLTVLMLAVRRRVGWRALGLALPRRWGLIVAAFLGSYAALFAYQLVLDLVQSFGVDVSSFQEGNLPPTGRTDAPYLIMLGVALVVVAPVMEELFFRGLLFRALAGYWQPWLAVALSGIAFGAFHMNLSVLVPFSLIGIVFAWTYWASGSLWTTIAAHAMVNGVSFVFGVWLTS